MIGDINGQNSSEFLVLLAQDGFHRRIPKEVEVKLLVRLCLVFGHDAPTQKSSETKTVSLGSLDAIAT